jgi:membrane peptidoglycan carboxypeptidase
MPPTPDEPERSDPGAGSESPERETLDQVIQPDSDSPLLPPIGMEASTEPGASEPERVESVDSAGAVDNGGGLSELGDLDVTQPVGPAPVSSAGDEEAGAVEPSSPEPYRPPYYAQMRAPISAAAERANRRRRRYSMYLRRTTRARAAARSATFARVTWASVIALSVLTLAVLTSTIGAAAAYYQTQEVSIAALSRTVAGRDSLRIYDKTGVLLYQVNKVGAQHSISIAQIPIAVINATIAVEDHTFWTNPGVDATSIIRAAQVNYSSGTISQGGSTITQQLIKQNILGAHETYTRKLQEAILAVGLTETGAYSKQQVLAMYLNSISYGHEAYGIESAAQVYFGYQADPRTGMSAAQHLDLAQASMLAGIPQNPNLNDPITHFSQARARQQEVLNDMVKYGYITKAQADAAWAEAGKPGFFSKITTAAPNLAPAFVYFVIDQLQAMVASGQLTLGRSGLNVYTTLDLDLQNHTQAAMKKHLYGNDRDDYGGYIRNDHIGNTAGIMVDNATGGIRVMLGSVDYYSTKINGEFNVVTSGYRSAGSAFKPIVYATAFSKGWFPAMTLSDTPTIFWDAGSQSQYRPSNYGGTWYGELTLRKALQNSRNIPAVKVMQFAGIPDVQRTAMRMGLRTWEGSWGLSSVLGTLDVTPYDMAQMYTVFANYGQFIPFYAIDRITDSSNNVLFQYQQPRPVEVLTPQVAYMITSVLEDNWARQPEFNPCTPLYLDPLTSPDGPDFIHPGSFGPIGARECARIYAGHGKSPNAWPAAAKTGTASDFTDDYTVGYTTKYTMAVWAGNNNHKPMAPCDTCVSHVDGVTGAAPTWNRAMLYAMQRDNLPKTDFPVPGGLQRHKWSSNGITTTDWFLAGPLPANNTGSTGENFHVCYPPNSPYWIICSSGPAPTPKPGPGGGGVGGGGGGGPPHPKPRP